VFYQYIYIERETWAGFHPVNPKIRWPKVTYI